MRRITLTADKHLIDAAQQCAANEHTTLNAKFREWLESYVQRQRQAEIALDSIRKLRSKYSTSGSKFMREEMNKRRN